MTKGIFWIVLFGFCCFLIGGFEVSELIAMEPTLQGGCVPLLSKIIVWTLGAGFLWRGVHCMKRDEE